MEPFVALGPPGALEGFPRRPFQAQSLHLGHDRAILVEEPVVRRQRLGVVPCPEARVGPRRRAPALVHAQPVQAHGQKDLVGPSLRSGRGQELEACVE